MKKEEFDPKELHHKVVDETVARWSNLIDQRALRQSFMSRQTRRRITTDDITNLIISLNTCNDVNDFIATI